MTPEQQKAVAIAKARLRLSEKQGAQNGPNSSLGRKAALASRGFTDRAADVVGALPELTASGLRAAGLPAPEKGYYPEKIKEGMYALERGLSAPFGDMFNYGTSEPQTTGERFAYGAGRGAADVGSFLVPAAAMSRYASAGSLPQLVGQTAKAMPATQVASGVVGGGTAEATESELTGLLTGIATPFAVQGASRLAQKAITPTISQLSPYQQELAKKAQEIGIPLTAGQKTGSPTLLRTESTFSQLPFTSGTQGAQYDAQRKAFNKAVLSKAGIDADDVTPDVMENAFSSIGKEFDDLAKATTITPDQQLIDDVVGVSNEYSRRGSADVAKIIGSYKDDFINLHREMLNNNKVTIEGEAYQNLSSDLKKRARSAGNNPDLQEALYTIANKLDDSLERSAGGELRGAWSDVRNRYRNLLTIEDAATRGTQADRSSGDVPFAGLTGAVKKMGKRDYSRGRGDLSELARVGDFMGAQRIPDAGTAQRLNTLQQLQMTGATGAGVGTGIAVDPVTGLIVTGVGLGGPKAAQSVYNLPKVQQYLTNQVLPSRTQLPKAVPLTVGGALSGNLGE